MLQQNFEEFELVLLHFWRVLHVKRREQNQAGANRFILRSIDEWVVMHWCGLNESKFWIEEGWSQIN